ncbi:MAG TPA: hypothetical protein VFI76_10285, partial [Terrimicrobiaceae bacterium]|nr:hypothetical protein [Terrimicrobiaceae bacterium]
IIPLLEWCGQQMGTTLTGDFDRDGETEVSILPGRMYHLRDRAGEIFNCRVKYNIDGNGGWPGIGEFGADLRDGGQDTLGRRALAKRQGGYETSRYNAFDYEHMTITQLVFCYVLTGSEIAKDQALTIANLITQPHFIPERVNPDYDGVPYEIYAKQAHWSGRTLGWTGLAWIYADAIDGEDTFFRDAAYFTIRHAVEGTMVERYGQAARDNPTKWLYRTSNLSPQHPDGTYVFLKRYPTPDPASILPLRFICTNELSAAFGALTQCYWTHEKDPATWWMCNPIESVWKIATVGMACQQGALFDPENKAKWDEWVLYIADAITYCWVPEQGMREHYGIVRATEHGTPAWFGRGYGGTDPGQMPPQKVGTASWVVGTGAYALKISNNDEARFPWAKPMWEFQRNFHGGGEFPSRVGGSVWMRSHLFAAATLDPHLN